MYCIVISDMGCGRGTMPRQHDDVRASGIWTAAHPPSTCKSLRSRWARLALRFIRQMARARVSRRVGSTRQIQRGCRTPKVHDYVDHGFAAASRYSRVSEVRRVRAALAHTAAHTLGPASILAASLRKLLSERLQNHPP